MTLDVRTPEAIPEDTPDTSEEPGLRLEENRKHCRYLSWLLRQTPDAQAPETIPEDISSSYLRKRTDYLVAKKKDGLKEIARKLLTPNPDAVAAGTGPWPTTKIVQPDAKFT